MVKQSGQGKIPLHEVAKRVFARSSSVVMESYIAQHKKLTGEDVTPRQVLGKYGFTKEEIAKYYQRTGLKE